MLLYLLGATVFVLCSFSHSSVLSLSWALKVAYTWGGLHFCSVIILQCFHNTLAV